MPTNSTLYLSRLVLNPEHAQARRDLAVPYDLHRTLSKYVFAGPRRDGEGKNEDRKLRHAMLFRIEQAGPDGVPVIVQCATKPNWSLLPLGYLLRLDGPKIFDLQLYRDQHLSFRLVANPTIKKKDEGKKHSVRVPLIHDGPNPEGHPTYFEWLHRQAEQNGFRVLHATDAPFRTASNRQERKNYEKHQIPHFGVRFDGVLEVRDPERVVQAVEQGIGPAKAFGFGLLSLMRYG